MSERAKLGSIGLGWWGGELASAVQRSGQGEVVSCFARSEDARKSFADEHGARPAGSLEELLADDELDGVLVATPHLTHADMIVAAAEAGEHTVVAKPLTLSVAEGRRAVEATEAAGVSLQVGHHRRRQPATRELRKRVDEGALGQLHLLEANLSLASNLKPKDGWRGNPEEAPLGGMTALGVHMADNLIYLAGPVKSVSALSRPLHGAVGLDDVTVFALEFESDALGYLGTSVVVPKVCTTVAFGTGGSAWSEEEGTRLFRQNIDQPTRSEGEVGEIDALADQMGEFAACARGERTPEVDGRQALEVVAVLEAGILSQQRGAVVELSEVKG